MKDNVDATPAAVLSGPHGRALELGSAAVMGVINATPDSFSDGGRYPDAVSAIEQALEMIDHGARVIDIGGESTRPGATPVTAADEIERVVPVIRGLRARSAVFISADTSKPDVMRAAIAAGADMINDVRALETPGALEAVAEYGAAASIMHMQGEPRTMQQRPVYDDVVAEVGAYLDARVAVCRAAGVPADRLCIDPGFGFGKTIEHNLALLRGLKTFASRSVPLLIGVSRKSMFSKLFASDDMASRINASVAAAFWAYQQGARIIRVHDVRQTCQALTLARALEA